MICSYVVILCPLRCICVLFFNFQDLAYPCEVLLNIRLLIALAVKLPIPNSSHYSPQGPDGRPRRVGGDLFEVHVEDPDFRLVPASVKDNGDGTYSVSYTPNEPGVYHIDVIQRNPAKQLYYDHVKGSPVDVTIDPGTDAANSIAYGPGLENGNLDTFPAHFTIEARDKKGRPMKEGGDPFEVCLFCLSFTLFFIPCTLTYLFVLS